VRSITQDDSHTFCKPDQIKEVIAALIKIVQEYYSTIGMDLRVRLSFRDDSPSYLGELDLWNNAENILKELVEEAGLEYYIGKGEAAFYGPKIDFMAKDALGRELQLATPQLDFVQPERFGLKYVDEDGSEKTPVMIHFALTGSIERFLAAYIEHSMGKFPVWLSPEQTRLITVNQEENTVNFAAEIVKKAQMQGLRVVVDNSNESVGKKIRSSELYKVPYTVVIGEKEMESSMLKPRIREDLKTGDAENEYSIDDFLSKLKVEYQDRLSKTTL